MPVWVWSWALSFIVCFWLALGPSGLAQRLCCDKGFQHWQSRGKCSGCFADRSGWNNRCRTQGLCCKARNEKFLSAWLHRKWFLLHWFLLSKGADGAMDIRDDKFRHWRDCNLVLFRIMFWRESFEKQVFVFLLDEGSQWFCSFFF